MAVLAVGASLLGGCSAAKKVANRVDKAVQSQQAQQDSKAENAGSTDFTIKIADTVDAKSLTKPGAELAINDPAVLGAQGQLDGSDEWTINRAYTTTMSVAQGDLADLKDVELTGAQTTSTPYYVTITAAWQSGTEHTSLAYLTSTHFTMLTSDDSQATQLKLILVGTTFPKCEANSSFAHAEQGAELLTEGEKSQTCMIFMVPEGKKAASVAYFGGDYDQNPVLWSM